MKRNRLGSSSLYISELGLGCMSLGTDIEKAQTIIKEAIDHGVNYLDTADLYDFGLNEEIVGAACKGVRDDIVIATKGGNHWEKGKEGWYWDPSKAYIKEAVKQSLLRLGVDYIDLYQLHGGTLEDPLDETIEAFEELKQEGVIRYYGISSIRPNVIREYVKRSNMVSVMMQFSMLDRRPEEEILPLLKEHGISVIARGPLAKGLLSSKWESKLTVHSSYLDYTNEELTACLSSLSELNKGKRSLEAAAFHYVLNDDAVASAIPGASSQDQVRENLRAIEELPLSPEEYRTIQSMTKSNTYSVHR